MTNKNNNPLHRSFLKWAGGKKKVIPHISSILPAKGKRRLVEPFVGGGSVFLNLEFEEYLLVDMNHDLIALFNIIKHQSEAFIAAVQQYFTGQHNQPEQYYALRSQFNASTDAFERAVLFVYLIDMAITVCAATIKKGDIMSLLVVTNTLIFQPMKSDFLPKKPNEQRLFKAILLRHLHSYKPMMSFTAIRLIRQLIRHLTSQPMLEMRLQMKTKSDLLRVP